MRLAILADIHDNSSAFARVLDDAATWDVAGFIFLGDAGSSPELLDELQARAVGCTFGNWEVSLLARLDGARRGHVEGWPACLRRGDALFCHATPDLPSGVTTTATAAAARAAGLSWSALFPRLHCDEDAVWQALGAMEAQRLVVAFHGHTHVQAVWTWTAEEYGPGEYGRRKLRHAAASGAVTLAPGPAAAPSRYIIGVGSVGRPEDGPWPRYAIYDEERGQVWLRAVGERQQG